MKVDYYIKRPVIIEAMRWTGDIDDFKDLSIFCPAATCIAAVTSPVKSEAEDILLLSLPTLEGNMIARPGDFIIKGVAGEFYPCKPEIFWETYDRFYGYEED